MASLVFGAISTLPKIIELMKAMKTEREPTVIYDIQCPPGLKMRLTKFWMETNLFKKFDVSKYNDETAHELNGTQLEVCGSGYALFYSDEDQLGIVLTFSNPDIGTNKIGGKIMVGREPTEEDGLAAWHAMDNAYGEEKVADECEGGHRLIVKNNKGDPATGYYKFE